MKKIIILVFVSLFISIPVMAKDQKFALSKVAYEGISLVQVHIQKDEFKVAKALLLKLEASKKVRKKQDKAYIRFYMGYFYSLQEDNVLALKYYKEALSYEALPDTQISNTYLNIVQILMDAQDYEASLVYLDKLIHLSKEPKSEYFVYAANAHLALKQYKQVIENLDKAITAKKEVKTSWIKTKFYAYYMLNDYGNAINMMKQLITREPKNKEYWIQLSSLYTVDNKLDKALCALDISRLSEVDLTTKERMQLISWLRYQEIPFKAAYLMQEGLETKVIDTNEKNLDKLGDMYYESKEYAQALSWYEKAAKLSKKGNIYFKIAQIQANDRHFQKALDAIKLSLSTTDEEKIGEKYLLLARTHYELGELSKAKKSFTKALQYKKSKKIARVWLEYLNKA